MIDIVVAGGGPIGLAAAIEARLAGFAATVVEPRRAPIDKACGEGLMPGAVAALARLGVEPRSHPIDGISYRDARRHVDHVFRDGPGRGVRRTVLHAALFDRATKLGVEFVDGRVDGLEQDGESVTARGTGFNIRARWMLGADGLHSTVRELVGLGMKGLRARRYGIRRHYSIAPWSSFVEVHWTRDAEVYVTPVADDEVGIAVLGPQRTDFDAVLGSVPSLAERLDGAPAASHLRGAGPLLQRTSARTAGRVLLVGDASGYVDAITGEGIRIGLAEARAAVGCLIAEQPGRYEREWERATRDYRRLTSGLVRLGATPLRRWIVPAARTLPGVYGSIVERIAR
ncbi:MAG: NAD(P)/FAD-dependent oxidoreductase [Cryobacterium sp.]|nr:NAD(P)/FAD-dependent oxidoreductase [Cryobacterium sp.]